jgi:phosphate/sulfate permease
MLTPTAPPSTFLFLLLFLLAASNCSATSQVSPVSSTQTVVGGERLCYSEL